jgi:two-component system CheB/CheR fusion protein
MAIKKPAKLAGTKNNGKSRSIVRSKAAKTPAGQSPSPTVVGIAGSAGALSALQAFFSALPAETGMAFVVITHLSPEHESHLASLLQGHTKMTVAQVNRKMPVRPNHVYVIPPSKNILVTNSHVDVTEFETPRSARTPIDFFFRSLARSHRNAVAIILSGSGTDGSVGVKDVKEEGGLLMVQDPEEAEYGSMPNAAIATGLVDVILPTRALAEKLMDYARQTPRLPIDVESLDEQEWGVVQNILTQVQRRTKHDFSQYKRSTVIRRVRRRMLLNSHVTLDAYLEYMRSHPAESFALLNDLLIGVTNFFRDHEVWEALKRDVIPQILKHRALGEPIRVWSVGCASGEEAYSLAIVFLEVASALGENRTIQIFASDIDEDSLARAREGLYPAAIEADVSPERLQRFFSRQGDHYRVHRELRDMILFTPHSVLRDPPFSRQDLICCRNLLIYLQRDIQQYILEVFHYGLNPGSYLFLGISESTGGKEGLFQTVDKTNRFYEALPWRPDQVHVPSIPAVTWPGDRPRILPASQPFTPHAPGEAALLEQQHRRSLEIFGPPSILVGDEYNILHVSDTAGRYLNQPRGPITNDLLKLARPELQGELRTALFHAIDKNRAIVTAPVPIDLDGVPRRVIMSVHPQTGPSLPGQATEKQALVVFLEDDPLPEPSTVKDVAEADDRDLANSAARATQLESEVRRLRDRLQSTQEEYDSSTEEMKASNEELQSMNEEYHLTTEELETSKEELEAVNEELQTVNNELKGKLDEISRAHQELENVMGAMEMATLFLDRGLRIQRYTPSLATFFNILKTDIGRPIDHLNHKLGDYNELTLDARRVLDSLTALDREVRGGNGEWFLIRLRPYRTMENKIEGVVISFVDITNLKEADEELRQLNETLEERVESRTREVEAVNSRLEQTNRMFSMLFHVNPIPTSLSRLQDGRFLDVNEAYATLFGLRREDIVDHTSGQLKLPFGAPLRADLLARLRKDDVIRDLEMEVTLPSGEFRTVLACLQRLTVDSTEAILATFIDITERVLAERQIRVLAANLTAAEQKERHRISQILHDDLQQRLFAVKMQLSFLQQAYQEGNTEGVNADTENLENWMTDAIETTRRLSVDLSPVILQGSSLVDSLAWLVEEMRERYGLEVQLDAAAKLPALDEHLRTLLFETIRELLFNVVKHGDILQAGVSLSASDGTLHIEISDPGRGFNAEQVLADSKLAHGLLDIRNRLDLLGCSMQIKSRPGEGTQVKIVVPAQAGSL